MEPNPYDEQFVQTLFDRMGSTYDLTNFISSLGFSEIWRYQCVRNLSLEPGATVCDMMSGTGECWRYLRRGGVGSLVSVDFSATMIERQLQRKARMAHEITVLKENATKTTIAAGCMDGVVSSFGLKTLSPEATKLFAREIYRILRPGGHFSLLEISIPSSWILAGLYRWYIGSVIPLIGRLFLGNIECYRMLGVYTTAFGSCESLRPIFRAEGLDVTLHKHFFGCATSLVGRKPHFEEEVNSP